MEGNNPHMEDCMKWLSEMFKGGIVIQHADQVNNNCTVHNYKESTGPQAAQASQRAQTAQTTQTAQTDLVTCTPAHPNDRKERMRQAYISKLRSPEAMEIWQKLSRYGYCTVMDDDTLQWNGSSQEYGYMIHIVSKRLGLRHAANDTIQWIPFRSIFRQSEAMEHTARTAIANDIKPYASHKGWKPTAKKILRALE